MLFALIVFRITRFPFTLLTRILLFCNPIVNELKVRLPSGFRSIRLLMEKFFPGHLLLTSLRSRLTDPFAVEMSLILKNSFNSDKQSGIVLEIRKVMQLWPRRFRTRFFRKCSITLTKTLMMRHFHLKFFVINWPLVNLPFTIKPNQCLQLHRTVS